MNECERALLFLISVQRWRCWLGWDWLCQYHYVTKMCKQIFKNPPCFLSAQSNREEIRQKRNDQVFPPQPFNFQSPSIPSLSLPTKRFYPIPSPNTNLPSSPRDRRRRHRPPVIKLPILPSKPTFQERIYAAFQQAGLGDFERVDVLVGVPVLGRFS